MQKYNRVKGMGAIPVIIGVIVVGLIVGASIFKFKSGKKASSRTETRTAKEELKTIEDEWGFRFSYPSIWSPEAAAQPDELSRWQFGMGGMGAISIWTKETAVQTIDEWVKTDPYAKKVSSSIDSTLGGVRAKKLFLEDPKRVTVASVDQGQVFLVELLVGDDKESQQTFNLIVDTFEFLPFAEEEEMKKSETAPQNDGEVIDEGEEVVE